MGRFRVYMKTFLPSGQYQSEFTEITKDVIKLGNISQTLDSGDYDLGISKNASVKITMRNDTGKYSIPEVVTSQFPYKRSESLIKITWSYREWELQPGFFIPGEEPLCGEVEIFKGLLDDIAGQSTITDQDIDFTVLGFESLLDKIIVPYTAISNGDLISDVLYAILNQSKITNLLTVSLANIVPSEDIAIDDKTSLQNKTGKEAIKNLLLVSNSILYIKNDVVYVRSRAANPTISYNFYGQSSIKGPENIIDIKNYRDGFNRTLNYWSWEGASYFARDLSSIDKYGVLKRQMKSELVTTPASITTLLQANRDEFSNPRTEFNVETPLNYETKDLFFSDRVTFDYPNVYVPFEGGLLPRYDQAEVYDGTARYPYGQMSLTLSDVDNFKILSRIIDTTKQTVVFGVRKI